VAYLHLKSGSQLIRGVGRTLGRERKGEDVRHDYVSER
jgi:hypothetical protein